MRRYIAIFMLAVLFAVIGIITLVAGFIMRLTPVVVGGVVVIVLAAMLLGVGIFSYSRLRASFVAKEERLRDGPRSTVRVIEIAPNTDVLIDNRNPWQVKASGPDYLGTQRTYVQTFSFDRPRIDVGDEIDVAFDPANPESYLLIVDGE